MTTPHNPNDPPVIPATDQPVPPSAHPPSPLYSPTGYPGQVAQPLPPDQMPGQYSQPYPPGAYPGQMPPYSQPYSPEMYPGQFSQAYPPGTFPGQMPGQFSQPFPPGMYPSAQPWQTGVATLAPPAPQQPPWYAWLAQPLPLWALLSLTGVLLLGLIAAFATGTDWAAGGLHAGIVAAGVFILVALATGVRSLVGMAAGTNPHRSRQFLGASLAGVMLLVVSGAGIGLPKPIHRLQASVLEKGGQFAQAIKEYQLAGETAPNSHDIARVYDAWGEQATAATQFDQAVAHFAVVITTFPGALSELNRAQTGSITAYTAWGKQATAAQQYAAAVQHFDALLNQSYCDTSCQTAVATLDATAYYHLAEQSLTNQDFAHAVAAFNALHSRFPAAPETGKIHPEEAQALLGLGLQDRNSSTCSDAVQIYQQLASQFADTPQGKQAAHDLKAPQQVIGHFSQALPAHTAVIAYLGRNLSNSMSSNAFFAALFANTPIKADGSFTFAPQPLGTYGLFWATTDSTGSISGMFHYYSDDNSAYYKAIVGPLCPFDFGQITDSPTPQVSVTNAGLSVTHSSADLFIRHNMLVNFLAVANTRGAQHECAR